MYLKHFNEIVISFEDKTVLQLSRRMDIMMRQVRMLAKVLAIHPSGKYNLFLVIRKLF